MITFRALIHSRVPSSRTVALAAVAALLLIPIVYAVGFAWFAAGLKILDPLGAAPIDLIGSLIFGLIAGGLTFGLSRLLVRGGNRLAAASSVAALVGVFTIGVAVATYSYWSVLPVVRTAMDGFGLMAGLVLAALPWRRVARQPKPPGR